MSGRSQIKNRSGHHRTASLDLDAVAAPLVALHVTPHAEGLAATGLGALEGLLASVGVAVDAQAAGSAEGLVASLADVPVLALGKELARCRVQVVVVLP